MLVRDDETGRRVARIVEVEAYDGPDDRASHARFGPTDRNRVMFGPPGFAYVYLVYGMYDCLNVVAGGDGSPSAVLIRAVEPVEGIDRMRADRLAVAGRRRATRVPGGLEAAAARLRAVPDHRLASGPGRTSAAFGLDVTWTGRDLCDPRSTLRLDRGPASAFDIDATPRIGVAYAGPEWSARPWRFVIRGHRSVSGVTPRSSSVPTPG